MGKLKKGRRSQRGRHNPARPAAKAGPDAKGENTRRSKVTALIAKLSSAASNDRSVALSAITVLVEDPAMRKLFLKERMVATVMEQTLNDSNEELVVDSFGLLRNLTLEEGYEVAKHLWRSNIWAAVEKSLARVEESAQFLADSAKAEKKTMHMLFDLIENVLSLIVLIASCSDDLYDGVYAKIDRVAKLVVMLLDWNMRALKTPRLANALLDFIYEFASDSAEFVQSLSTMPGFSISALQASAAEPWQSANKLGQVLTLGIAFHLLEVLGPAPRTKSAACLEVGHLIFATITSINIDSIKASLSAADNAEQPIQKPAKDEKPQDIDVPFGGESADKIQARSELQAIDVSVDIFASICEYLAVNEADFQEPVELTHDTAAFLLEVAYPACLHLLVFDLENLEILQLVSKILTGLNNMCWLLLSSQEIPVAWFDKIPELWSAVVRVLNTGNLEYERLALNIMWGLCKCLGPAVGDKVSPKDVTDLLAKCEQLGAQLEDGSDNYQSLDFLLSAVGFMGTVAQVIGDITITKNIAGFLLSLISHFSSTRDMKAVEIPIECLNLIYDIFGDAQFEYDYPVFVEGNYLARLRELEPQVRAMYKHIDRNKNAELKLRAEEVWNNLGRFIDYKEHERA